MLTDIGRGLKFRARPSLPLTPRIGDFCFHAGVLKSWNGTDWNEVATVTQETIDLLHLDTNVTDLAGPTWVQTGGLLSRTTWNSMGLPPNGASYFYAVYNGYHRVESSNSPALGAGNFTIDLYLAIAGNTYVNSELISIGGGASLTWDGSNHLVWNDGVNATQNFNMNNATWYHVALARQGTTLTAYLDGSVAFSYTCSVNFGAVTRLGKPSSNALEALFSEFRVTNYPVWTAPFTPPTAPYSYP